MAKPEIAWCVVSEDGRRFLWSLAWFKRGAVYCFIRGLVKDTEPIVNAYHHPRWREALRDGHRCVKVEVRDAE